VVLDAGGSFGLFAQECARLGLSVYRVDLQQEEAEVSLPPFVHALKLLRDREAMASCLAVTEDTLPKLADPLAADQREVKERVWVAPVLEDGTQDPPADDTPPSSVPVPTPMELTKFLAQGPAQVMQQWQQVPQSYIDSGQAQGAQQLFASNSIWAGATANLSRITGALAQLSGAVDLSSRIGAAPGSAGSVAGAIDAIAGAGAVAGASAGPLAFVCPAGATPFALHYQSNLDAFFWRSLLPLEQLYPASWLPGLREVGSGAMQTWGSVFPRQGSIVQQHPVKGSAVLAQRAADIVGQPAQPHIYTPLDLQPDGYVWFGFQGIRENDSNHTRWQRLYPNPSRTCVVFGSNDVITPASYGDGANVDDRGAVWNLWRRQECCQRAGSAFLGSVSF
jgi:hypothetical protein